MFRLHKSIFSSLKVSFSTHSYRKPYQHGTMDNKKIEHISQLALKSKDYFGVNKMVSMRDLFENRVHLGHRIGKRNAEMNNYITGTMDGISVIDLDETLPRLKRAMNFVSHVVYRNGIIVFANERPHFTRVTQELAKECGEYFVTDRWISGTFTNSATYLKTAPYPDVVIVFNCVRSTFLIEEAERCCIPIVAICDSDSNPNTTMYAIPGNDDTTETVLFYMELFKRVVLNAKMRREQDLIRNVH